MLASVHGAVHLLDSTAASDATEGDVTSGLHSMPALLCDKPVCTHRNTPRRCFPSATSSLCHG